MVKFKHSQQKKAGITLNRIKELRQKKKLTQKELAKELGLTQSVIGRYEQGDISPRPDKWQKMADFFGVSVDYLKGAWSKSEVLKLIQDCYIENLDYISELEKDKKDIIKQVVATFKKESYSDILDGVKELATESPQKIFKNIEENFDAKKAVNSNEFEGKFSEVFDERINNEFEQKKKNIKLAHLTDSENDNKEKLLAASIQDYFESIKDYLDQDSTLEHFYRLYPLTFEEWPEKSQLKQYLKEYAADLKASLQIILNGSNKMLVLQDSYIWQTCFSSLANDELIQNLMQTKAPQSTLLIAIRLVLNSYVAYLDNLPKEFE